MRPQASANLLCADAHRAMENYSEAQKCAFEARVGVCGSYGFFRPICFFFPRNLGESFFGGHPFWGYYKEKSEGRLLILCVTFRRSPPRKLRTKATRCFKEAAPRPAFRGRIRGGVQELLALVRSALQIFACLETGVRFPKGHPARHDGSKGTPEPF